MADDAARLIVGLIGYGYWGPNVLRNYMELPPTEVKWVCDLRPEALYKAQARYPAIGVTQDQREVLGDPEVDAVLIATPITTHFPLAKAALESGKHVFIEKPMAASSAECKELITLAGDLGRTLMVGHTFVFSPPVRKVKDILESGELGDVYFITSSRVNLGLHQKDASVVWDLGPHDLSILHYWLGEPVSSVSVMGRGCVKEDIPDVAFMNLRFGSGVIAEVQMSWLSPVKLRRTIIVGSQKMLLYDDTEVVEKVKLFDHGVDLKDPESFGEFTLTYRTGDILAPRLDTYEPLYAEAAHFVECIQNDCDPVTDGVAGIRVVATLEAAERSLHAGGREETVEVPF